MDEINKYGAVQGAGFSVLILDHGNVASQSVGGGARPGAGAYIDEKLASAADRDKLADTCRANGVSFIYLGGCLVANEDPGLNNFPSLV